MLKDSTAMRRHNAQQRFTQLIILGLFGAFELPGLFGCSSCSAENGIRRSVCQPKDTRSCVDSDGCKGTQICSDSGRDWSSCDCSAADDAGAGGREAAAGAATHSGGASGAASGTHPGGAGANPAAGSSGGYPGTAGEQHAGGAGENGQAGDNAGGVAPQADPDNAVVGEGTLIPETTKHGTIALSQIDAEGLAPNPSAVAGFQDSPISWGGCSRYPVGEHCYFYDCPGGLARARPLIDGNYPASSAGTLTVSVEGKPHELARNLTSGAYSATIERLWSTDGSPVAVTATGGDVPAFELRVTAPSTTTVTTPRYEPTEPLNVLQAEHFKIAWIPGEHGFVRVSVSTNSQSHPRPALFCTFPIQWGEASIPRAALEQLGPDGAPYTLHIFSVAQTTTIAGDWELFLSATAYADPATGLFSSMLWLR